MSAEMTSAKKTLRRQIAAALRALDGAELESQSQRVAERVCALPEFRAARALSVYLAMPREAATGELLAAAFTARQKVYVPKITGRSAPDLRMLHAQSPEDVASFPKVRGDVIWVKVGAMSSCAPVRLVITGQLGDSGSTADVCGRWSARRRARDARLGARAAPWCGVRPCGRSPRPWQGLLRYAQRC